MGPEGVGGELDEELAWGFGELFFFSRIVWVGGGERVSLSARD